MRFTLKTLLTTILVAAILCCVFFTLPALAAIAILGMLWLLAPPAIIAGIVYGRGYGRAFCIGCVSTGGIIPVAWMYASMMLFSVISELNSLAVDAETAMYLKLGFAATMVLMGLSGLIAMAVRYASIRLAGQAELRAGQTAVPPEYSVLHRRVTTLTDTDPDEA